MPRRKVLLAMSGGVDSSVAAARLVEEGHEVIGATMKLFCYGGEVSTGAFLTNPPGQAQLQLLLQGNGEENALSFSMRYNPHILTLGAAAFIPATNATVTVTNIIRVSTNVFPSLTNDAVTVTNLFTNGVVGVTMRLDPGRTFLRTNVQVIGALRFDVVGTNSPLLGNLIFEDFLPPLPEPILPFAAADTEGNPLGLGAVLCPSGVLLQEVPVAQDWDESTTRLEQRHGHSVDEMGEFARRLKQGPREVRGQAGLRSPAGTDLGVTTS